ncbi:MAG: PQ-loop domain-containing transporter [Sarcina sp.]
MSMYTIGNIAQLLGSCTLVYAYFPQIYRLFKYKQAEGMNLQFWTILTIGLTCVAINLSICDVNYFIQGTQWFNVILAFIVLVLSVKYKRMAKRKAQHN